MEKKDKKSGRHGKGLDTIGKRILVLTIAILMTFQFCTPTFYGVSFAEEITDVTEEELSAATAETADATEEVQEEAEPQEEATETVLEETETEEVVEAPEVSDVEEQAEPAVPEEDATATEEPAAEPAEEVQDEEQTEEPVLEEKPEEVAYPAQNFDDTTSLSDVDVHVIAPEGALPEGTKMTVKNVGFFDMRGVKNAVAEEMGSEAKVVKAVDITFFDKDGNEVQPKDGFPLQVSMNSAEFADINGPAVVHVDDNKNAEVVSEDVAGETSDEVVFDAEHFSIYAIVETGTDARVLVKFMNGESEIAHMYVKEKDDMDVVLYDPGAGTLADGVYFKGWTTDPDYTTKTEALTIEDIRDEVEAMLPPDQDGTPVTYYAMLFKDYRITYLDENEISLGQEEVTFRADGNAEQSYKVNMAYTVQNENYHFEGWKVKEGSTNIIGYQLDKAYQNNEIITITGDITFSVNAPEGHWFIFDQNGKGATYNAPQFVYSGETPTRPNDDNMIRNGYTFGGWFEDKAVADQTSGGTEYDFEMALTDKKTVYARWIPKTTAGYTIIIWKQNLEGDGYDFYDSIPLTGSVGATINTVSGQGSGDNAYARINGTNYNSSYTVNGQQPFKGFHLKEYDQNVRIKTEGNSVLNVYYDRNEYTLRFQVQGYTYTATTSDSGTQYGLVNGQYVELTRHNGGSWWDPSYYWTYGNNIRYNGTRYTRSSGWQTIKEIKALYQQNILLQFPIEGTNGVVYNNGERWQPVGNTSVGNGNNSEVIVSLNTMPAESIDFHLNTATRPLKTMYYYVEALPGDHVDKTVDGINFTLLNTISARYNFVRESGDFTDIDGFQKYKSDPAFGSNGRALDSSNDESIDFYYTRKHYPINFMDGKYVNGENNPLEEDGMGQISAETGIAYGADVSSRNDYVPDAAHTPAGFVFEGWYIDSACTQKYTFTKMPEGGITVYAKWRQKEYRVFLHVNYPDGATGNINWGSENQAMTFRISEGGHVSEPTGRDLAGFAFDGWYLDPDFTQVFNGEAYAINENTVTDPYDKTVDMTDTYNVNGQLIGPNFNSDLTGYDDDGDESTPGKDRFWITKKLDIYAKWHSTLEGASGIVVEYDADAESGGYGAPTDTHTYVDTAKAPAGAASKTTDTSKVFGYWEVQKWENGAWTGTGTKVLPGDTFSVLKANAKVENLPTPAPNGDTRKYTVQLKAVYIDSEEPTPTHISWFKNDGEAAYITSQPAVINVGVDIPAAPTRKGYDFLGWARVDTGNTTEAATAWEATSSNWTQDLTASDLYLTYADGAYTIADGTAVTQVAPDENLPYHAMFAVWKEKDVTINYAVASDSTSFEGVSVNPTSETVKAASGTAAGSTASCTSSKYVLDHWTVDDQTTVVEGATATFVPSKVNGVYEEHTYYAHFRLNEADYTVNHYLLGTDTAVKEADTGSAVIDSAVSVGNDGTVTIGTGDSAITVSPATTYQSKNLTYNSYDPATPVTISEDGNVITIYYTLPLTITAETKSKTYDGDPLVGEFTITGQLESDTETIEAAVGTAPSITNVSDTPNPKPYQATVTGIPSYYAITNNAGTLTISKRAITVTATGGSKQYDGSPITAADTGYTISSGTLAAGDAETVTLTGERTLVGSADAVVSNVVIKKGETDVTANYDITKVNGTLTITNREAKYEITLVANSNTGNTYDGTEKEATGVVTDKFTFDGVEYTVSNFTTSDPKETNAGTYPNTITSNGYVVTDPDGNDVSEQFAVTPQNGSLEIAKRAITVTATGGSKQYDGSPITAADTGYTISSGTLAAGDAETVTLTGERTLVGSADAVVSNVVIKKGETDVTANYDITKVNGTLTITNREAKYEITLVANSNTGNTYDGTEKEATGVVTDKFTFDGVEYTVSNFTTSDPKETNAGTYPNTITSNGYVVTDPDGNDVSEQFAVTPQNGSLEIAKRAITVTATGGSKQYDGSPITAADTGYTISSGTLAAGDAETVTLTGERTLVGSADAVVSNVVIKKGETDVTANYDITKVNGTLTITNREAKYEITLVANSNTGNTYDGTEKEATGVVTDKFTFDGVEYTVSNFTTSDPKETNAGTYPNTITSNGYVVTDPDGNDVSEQFAVTPQNGSLEIAKRAITVTATGGSKQYDGSPITAADTGYTISSGTLAAGDAETVTLTGERTLVGSADAVVSNVVIKKGETDVTANYDITKVNGTLTITNREAKYEITLVANSNTGNTYDGTEKEATGVVTDKFTFDGVEYTVSNFTTSDPKETNAGTYPNTITSNGYVVTDPDGNDVSEQFAVTPQNGSLEIAKRAITVTATGGSKQYDGSPITAADTGYTISSGTLAAGDAETVTLTGERTLVGSADAVVSNVVIKKGETDVTANYDITKVNGTLTITNREAKYEITLVANSNTGNTYDGTEKEATGVVTDKFTFDGVEYTVSNFTTSDPKETNAGTYPNTITSKGYVVTDPDGNDVSEQFAVTPQNGSLEIAKRAITVTATGGSKQYDGSPITAADTGYTISSGTLAAGDAETVTLTGERTLVGSADAVVSNVVIKKGETDVTANYDITKVNGTLTITNREAKYEITLVANSNTGNTYDGTEKEATGVVTDKFTFDGVEYTVSNFTTSDPKETNAGTYPNTITSKGYVVTDPDGNDVSEQFAVTPQNGSLEIAKRAITVTATGGSKQYDGSPITAADTGYTISSGTLAAGDAETVTLTGERTLVGSADAVVSNVVIKKGETDVTANYDITKVNGTLTITNREAKYEITLVANSNTGNTYDGTEKEATGVVTDKFTFDGVEYTVSNFTTSDPKETNAGTYPNTITSNGYVVTDPDGNDVSEQFAVTPQNGSLEIAKRAITVTATGGSKQYDGSPITAADTGYTISSGTLAAGDAETVTLTGERTLVGSADAVVSNVVIKKGETDVTANYDITKVNGTLTITNREAKYEITLVANSNTGNTYDGTEKEATGVVTDKFTFDGVEYTVSNFTTSDPKETNAGTYPNTITSNGYVVTDPDGNDVSEQFAVTPQNGSLEIAKRAITVTATGGSKQYDGSPITAADTGYTISSGTLAAGDAETVTLTGERTLVGSADAVVSNVVIKKGETDVTANYDITKVNGTLTITNREAKYEITLVANSNTGNTYDGTEKEATGVVTDKFTFDGVEYTVSNFTTSDPKETNAGTYPNTITSNGYVVTDPDGNDVSEQFAVTPQNGSLEIAKRAITVTATGGSKQYDGSPITAADTGYTISSGTLAAGDAETVTLTGERTLVGSADAVVSNVVIKKGETDVTANYDITKVNGTLTITNREAKYEITLVANSNTGNTYDGTEKEATGVVTDKFTFDGVEYTVSNFTTSDPKETNAGTYPNTITSNGYVVTDPDGNDVSEQFAVTPQNGSLEIAKMDLTITADSDSKVYDGTALTKNSYTNTALAAGDEIESVTVTGSQTTVGSSDNVPSAAVIKNAAGENVTASYNITYANGSLEVTSMTVTITADSDTKVYDGTPLTKNSYTNTALAEGDTIDSVTITGSQTVVGTSNNVPSGAKIVNAAGEDVTASYEITYQNGSLEVTAKPITITADSDTKVYDGTPLTKNSYTNTALAAGDEIETVTVTGSQTVVGSSNNVPSAAKIVNAAGDDVTASYNITYANGTLTVTVNSGVTITADSDTKVYDGTALTKNTYQVSGLAEGDSVESVTVTGSQTVAGTSNNVPSGAKIVNAAGEDVTASYEITYQNGSLEVTAKPITITADSDTKVYDGTPLTKNSYTNTALAEGDTIDSVTITGSQTAVGTSNNVPSAAKIVNAAGDDVTACYNISYANGTLEVTQKTVTITADSAEKVYDGTALTKATYTYSALAEGDSVEVVTVTGSQTVAGSSDNVPSAAKIVNAAGDDVTASYSITYANGTLTVTKKDLTITADSDSKVYDGTPLTKNSYTNSALAEGDEIDSVTVTGSQTVVGSSDNIPSEAVIKNAKGDDVTASYNITYANGTLTVTQKTLTITADSDEKVYDGTPLTKNSYTNTALAEGDTIESVTITGSQTVVGTSNNVPSAAKIVNAAGDDVTASYSISYANGTLTVTQKDLTITADSDSKVYDGTALTKNSYTNSALAEGDTIESVTVTGSQTVAGTSNNVPSAAKIVNAAGDDVTASYNITYVNGTLEVTPRPVTITADSDEKVYDGTPLTKDSAQAEGLATGDKLDSVTVTGSQTVAGTSNNVPSAAKIVNAAGEDVTSSYTITYANGTLTVTQRDVTVTADSDEKVYDGTPLTKDSAKAEGLATGDKLDSVTVTGSQTDVGTSNNVPSAAKIVNAAGDDVTASYNITYANGTLEVTPKPVTITADDANKIYGEDDPDLTATVVGAVDGETLDYTVTREEGETVKVGEDGTISGYTITVTPTEGKNGNYQITTETGTFTINKRPITLQSKDAEKVYDGKELRREEVEVLGDYGLATKFGDTIRYFDFSSRTLVGSSPNEFDYEITQDATASGNGFTRLLSKLGIIGEAYGDEIPDHVTNDIEKNYDITVKFGTLTVTDKDADPDDVIVKTHTDETGESQTYKVGETITFTITVTNIYDEAKTITLTELEGVTFENGESTMVIEDVPAGETVTTTATYTVTEKDALAGTFKNTVKAEYSGEDEPFTNDDEVKDFAHMTVEKKVTNTPADGKAFRTGETIKYEITVKNDGTAELKDIVVKDELTGDEWKIDSLAAGKSKTFKAEYLVTEKDGAAGSVTNVATAEGTDPDGDKTPGTPGEVKTTTDKADEPVVPKTGDNTPIVEFSVIFGASIITLLMMLFRRKKERA